MPDASKNGLFEIVIEPRPRDEQMATLSAELRAEVDTAWRAEGGRLIVALGSAGAFSAVVGCLRAWLGRDNSRRIDVYWDAGGTGQLITLTGADTDVQAVR